MAERKSKVWTEGRGCKGLFLICPAFAGSSLDPDKAKYCDLPFCRQFWGSQKAEAAIGSTILGSSTALSGFSMEWEWVSRRPRQPLQF